MAVMKRCAALTSLVVALASCASSRPPIRSSSPSAASAPGPVGGSCSSNQPKACRDEAAQRLAAGDLSGALALQNRACDMGDSDACFAAAVAIHDGKGTKADVPKGRKLFADGCQRGHAMSCATLGALLLQAHEEGRGSQLRERACGLGHQVSCNDIGVALVDAPSASARDLPRARELFQRACDSGVAAACSNLALQTEVPEGDKEAEGKVIALFTRACEGKSPSGCRELGARHINGQGIPKDEVAGASEVETACHENDAAGCDWLGYTEEYGIGRPKDAPHAVANYGKACDKANASGCYNLGRAYASGRAISKDEKHARDLYESGCAGGLADACSALGNLKVGEDTTTGEARLQKLCDEHKAPACLALGRRLVWKPATRDHGLDLLKTACDEADGDACVQGLYSADMPPKGVKRKPEEVFHFAERACSLSQRCGKLAKQLLFGDGTKIDVKRAGDVAVKSCDKKDGQGCQIAAKIYQDGKGVPRDAKKAFGFLERGCDNDDAEACEGLARALRNGTGAPRDAARAAEVEAKTRDLRED